MLNFTEQVHFTLLDITPKRYVKHGYLIMSDICFFNLQNLSRALYCLLFQMFLNFGKYQFIIIIKFTYILVFFSLFILKSILITVLIVLALSSIFFKRVDVVWPKFLLQVSYLDVFLKFIEFIFFS